MDSFIQASSTLPRLFRYRLSRSNFSNSLGEVDNEINIFLPLRCNTS